MNTMMEKGLNTKATGDYRSLPEIVRTSRSLKCNEWIIFPFYSGMPSIDEVKDVLSKCPGTFAVYRTINGIGVRRLSE